MAWPGSDPSLAVAWVVPRAGVPACALRDVAGHLEAGDRIATSGWGRCEVAGAARVDDVWGTCRGLAADSHTWSPIALAANVSIHEPLEARAIIL